MGASLCEGVGASVCFSASLGAVLGLQWKSSTRSLLGVSRWFWFLEGLQGAIQTEVFSLTNR